MSLARLTLLLSLTSLLPPSLGSAQIVLSVKEHAAPGKKIGFVHRNGQGLPAGLRYRLSHHSRHFGINESSGGLWIKSVVDREHLCTVVRSCCPQTDPNQRCFIPLKVLLEDRSHRPVKIVNVQVLVEDINDESPQFATASHIVHLAEDAPIGTVVNIPAATDADTDQHAVKSYKLTRCDESVFNLTYSQLPGTRRSHEVRFVLNKKLDHETKVQYVCRIQASDGVHEEAMDVKLMVEDVNDHAPQWSNSDFHVVLHEDQARYSTVFTLAATDPDQEFGKITFGFGPTFLSTAGYFSLDQKSGAITLNRELNYDANGQQSYLLPIIARDNGMPVPKSVTGTLTIEVTDVNDNSPQINVQEIRMKIPENAPARFLSYIEVTDKDQGENGKVKCILNNFKEWFNLTKLDAGSYGFYSTGPIDRELARRVPSNGMLKVEMICEDGGKPPQTKRQDLMIYIEDVNDHRPKFSRSTYTTNLAENQPAGTVFLQLAATDEDAGENAKLEFGLLLPDKDTESVADLITVESHSGAVTSAVSFDREKKAEFEFSVIVRDRGNPRLNDTAKVRLIIRDLNDNAPSFVHPSQTTFHVKENAPRGTIVGKINATDKDEGANGSVVFSQRYGRDNSGRMFSVSKTGEIRLKLPLDRERTHEYSLTVQASDEGSPALTADTTVVINVVDVNDSPPKFDANTITNINISCDEAALDTFHQAMIHASDPDENSEVVYSLGKQNTRGHQFAITPQGQLTIAKRPAKCVTHYFKLTVIATDKANSNFFDRKDIHVYVHGYRRPVRPPVRIIPGSPADMGVDPMLSGGHPDDPRGAADFDLNLLIIIILVCTAIVLTFVMLAAALYLRKRQLRAAQEYEKGRREMPDGGTLRRDKEKLGGHHHHPGSAAYAASLPSSPRKEFDQLKKTNMSMEDMYHEHELDSKTSRLKLADPSCAKLKGSQYCSDIADESGVPLNAQISHESAHTYQSMASQKESPENAGYTIFQHELFSYIPDTLRSSANVDSKKKKTSQVTISFV